MKIVYIYIMTMLITIMWLSISPYSETKSFKLKNVDFKLHGVYDQDDNFIKFNDTVALPRYVDDYVGYVDNDEIYKYRVKLLTTEEEIITYFGNHDDISKYKNGPSTIQKSDTKLKPIFWIVIVILIITLLVRILAYFYVPNLDEEMTLYGYILQIVKILFFLLESMFLLVLIFSFLNYKLYVTGFFIGIPLSTIAFIFYNVAIDDNIDNYIFKKNKQQNIINKLNENYKQLNIK